MQNWQPADYINFRTMLRIDEIIVDENLQMRADGTNPVIVARYAGVMNAHDPDGWSQFPLIKVMKVESSRSKYLPDYYLVSGFHRLEAMKKCGYPEVQVDMFTGTYLDAKIMAAGENADRSQPRTNDDIKRIVEMCLLDPEIRQWTNAQIARWCQVDHQTVTNHERRLMSDPNFEYEPRPEKLKYIDKHGNVSLRKRHTIHLDKDDDPADVTVITMDSDTIAAVEADAEIQKQELMREIVDLNHRIEGRFVFGSPTEREAQRAELIQQYPGYENFFRKESLPNEDLKHLHDALTKIEDALGDESIVLRQQINGKQWDIRQAFDCNYDWRRKAEKVIAEKYPDYANVEDAYKMTIPRLKLLKSTVETVHQEIESNGWEQFMPPDYVKASEKQDDDEAGDELADLLNDAKKEAVAAFKELMGSDKLTWQIEDDFLWPFIKEYNKHHDGVTLTGTQVRAGYWGFRKKPVNEVKKMTQGWKEVCACIQRRPAWINEFVWDTCAEMSRLKVQIIDYGRATLLETEKHTTMPLSAEDHTFIVEAVERAVDEAYVEIATKRVKGSKAILRKVRGE